MRIRNGKILYLGSVNSLMRIRDGKILDPGWKNYYPGSGMIRDKHPESATLEQGKFLCSVSPLL
jgi:hypothetical protein